MITGSRMDRLDATSYMYACTRHARFLLVRGCDLVDGNIL